MMITEISSFDRKRFKISFDDKAPIVLYGNEMRKYDIREGFDLPDAVYEEIIREVLLKRCKLRGLKLLTARTYTESQLRIKYIEGGYPTEVIDNSIEYLKDMKLIDDYRYACTYLECAADKKSLNVICRQLSAKGIDKAVIERAVEEADADDLVESEKSQIDRIMTKRHYDRENAGFEDMMKMKRYLYSKGFSSNIIDQMLGRNNSACHE